MTSPSAPVVRDVPKVGDVWRLQWGSRNQWIDWEWLPDRSYACVAAGSKDGHQPGYRTKNVEGFGCGKHWSLIHRPSRLLDAEKPVEAKPVEAPKPAVVVCTNCEGGSGHTRYWNGSDEVVEDCANHQPGKFAGPPVLAGERCGPYSGDDAGHETWIAARMQAHNDAFAERHKQAIADRLKGSIWSPVDYGPTARVVLARGGRR